MLDNLHISEDIQSDGDGVFRGVRETNLYRDTIKMAYLHKSQGGANAIVLDLESECGSSLKTTIYFTSGTAKGGKNYYEAQDGTKRYLPGFERLNDLALIITGQDLSKQNRDTRVVNIYNFEAREELPTNVEALSDWIGKEIVTAVEKQTVSKRVRNDDGKWVPTADTREENEIVKFFYPESAGDNALKTVVEAAGEADANYYGNWLKRNEGKTKDKTDKNAPKRGSNPLAGKTAAADKTAAASEQTSSLFQ